jgi:hypothetical protein
MNTHGEAGLKREGCFLKGDVKVLKGFKKSPLFSCKQIRIVEISVSYGGWPEESIRDVNCDRKLNKEHSYFQFKLDKYLLNHFSDACLA